MKLSLWFIRHIPTGKYLPEPHGRAGRGGSHGEPQDTDPRIFRSKGSAAKALGAWLKGKWIADRGMSEGHPGNDWERDYYEEISVIPQPHRIREDMEIIEKEIEL